MKTFLKILLLFFAVQLALAPVERIPSPQVLSEIQEQGESQYPFGYPEDHSILYVLQHKAESPAEVTNTVPQLQSNTEQNGELFGSSAPESAIQQWLTFYIKFGSFIEPGHAILRIIFPFHFFL